MTRPALLSPPFGGAFVLGFALSGFFDGVLLHQILQWHHLLSLVDAPQVESLHAQILADGAFHALMYAVAVVGLILLWRSRHSLGQAGGSRRLVVGVLAGFGVWNIVDVGLFHWILEIHHIRLDVSDPVLWDAGWLVVLGLLPLLAAVAVARGAQSPGGAGRGPAAIAVFLAAGLGAWNLRPPPAGAETMVLLRPGVEVMDTVVAADARLVQIDASGSIAILRLPDGANPWMLYRHGALMVQGAGPSGCFSWSRPTAGAAA
ncbi:MAG TPA: DUF2243 domain-containing protein [Brevundimonas sp.]|uniref:DUF2243 domain-containing protein n=1 Tax=Brevundimonas sp. TaxID=1871086 RepID=UPI002ED9197F